MASVWTRFRMNYIGTIRLSRMITPVLMLVGLYLIFRWSRGPKFGIVNYKNHHVQHKMSEKEIGKLLYNIKDTRPDYCMIAYNVQKDEQKPAVSILVDFHEEELYNLKLTLSSIVENTPDDLYSEIILLDDGTNNIAIREHAAEFLQNQKFVKVKAFRSTKHEGRGFTRFKAAKVAEGEILVYVSSNSVVNVGWLPPLINALQEKEMRIIVPHADNLLSEGRFFQMDDNLVNTFSWPLSTVYMETSEETGKYLKTPVMRGDVLAVTKAYLETIGNYDNDLDLGGGHDLELSLRTWLCGGQILVATCSRIATHSALKPVEITSMENFKRIAELWLDENKEIAYKQGNRVVNKEIPKTTSERKREITKWLICKKFDWYLNNVATNILAPSDDFVYYGKLKAASSYCVRSVSYTSSVLDLVLCRPYMYDPALIFEYDKLGFIKMGDKCLMASGIGSRIVFMDCQEDNKQEQWNLDSQGQIHSTVYPDSCLTHVTQTVQGEIHEHHMVLKHCRDEHDQRQYWNFINY